MRKRNAKFAQKHPDGIFTVANPFLAVTEFSQAEADRILAIVRTALVRMLDGTAEDKHFATLGSIINIAAVRAETGTNPEQALQVLGEAGQALEEAMRIRNAHGKYGLTGPGRNQLAEGVEAYAEILRASTPRQMHEAEQTVTRRLAHMNRRKEPELQPP